MPRLTKYSPKPDGFILPAQPKLITTPPNGPDWLHEIKYDGYRVLAVRKADSVQLWARSGIDWSIAFAAVREAILALPDDDFAIDGEVVGTNSFYDLRSRVHQRQAHMYAFDLLRLGGEDLRRTPLIERKCRLTQILPAGPGYLHYVDHLTEDGPLVFRHACALGLEGIVSKRRDSTYRSGPTRSWVKTKNPSYDRRGDARS